MTVTNGRLTFRVSVTIQKYLAMVDGRRQDWSSELNEQISAGGNVFATVPNAPSFLEELANALDIGQEQLPAPLNRSKLFSLSPYIEPKDSDAMLAAQDDGCLVFFIEQLDLPSTRPPRVKPFLVYCSVRGIISQHDDQRAARESCSDYQAAMSGLRNQHDAAVYKWRDNDNEWYNTETC